MEQEPKNSLHKLETIDSEELKLILSYFEIEGEISKESTRKILEHAYRLLQSTLQEQLRFEESLEIDGKIFTLLYEIYPRKSGNIWIRVGLFQEVPPANIGNTSLFNEGEISMTRLMFNFEKNTVKGEFETNKDYEGLGYGSAMLLMRGGIIKNIMKKYSDKISASGLRSEIVDNSRSQNSDRQYEGLTTTLAKKMGYEQIEENKYIKQYKPD
ncbi:MAG: hypothetical protein HYW79_00425 [Parcubacteria group bacterium]|nr:hypothetical protein [Parcubacteria group bacterium]